MQAMPSTTPALQLPARAAAGTARRLALDTGYLVLGLPMGIATFTIAVTELSLALGLAITLIGLPLFVVKVWTGRLLARVERRRAAMVLGAAIPERYAPLDGPFLHRFVIAVKDAQTWKDFAWELLLLPVGIAGFTVAVTSWATSLAFLATPLWWWAVPDDARPHTGLFTVDSWPLAAAAALIGVVLVPLAAALVRGSAALTARLAQVVLGPGRGELERRVERLSATRAGAVDAAAAELERLERDLHDGAQARLVAVALELGMAEDQFDGDLDGARARVAAARHETRRALAELRDIARGMRPGLLAERGLEAAVTSLAARSAVPSSVVADVGGRLPAPVESAAYYVVAEALANAGKHARAGRATVTVTRHGDMLDVIVRDDGRGGANPDGGGLAGLRKRVEALDGTLDVVSPRGGGTTVRAELPCGS
jgi:signal transduction histidine kinase